MHNKIGIWPSPTKLYNQNFLSNLCPRGYLHENEAAVVAGWGVVDWETSNTSDTLNEATVNIRPNDWCKSHSFLETFYDER